MPGLDICLHCVPLCAFTGKISNCSSIPMTALQINWHASILGARRHEPGISQGEHLSCGMYGSTLDAHYHAETIITDSTHSVLKEFYSELYI